MKFKHGQEVYSLTREHDKYVVYWTVIIGIEYYDKGKIIYRLENDMDYLEIYETPEEAEEGIKFYKTMESIDNENFD